LRAKGAAAAHSCFCCRWIRTERLTFTLISIPPKIERALLAFARVYPEEPHSIEKNLKFRQEVAREFERRVREGAPISEFPEAEGPELKTAEET
jgi:hypothetical protein